MGGDRTTAGAGSGGPPLQVLLLAPSYGDFGGVESFIFRLARTIDLSDDMEVTICFKRVAPFKLWKSLGDALEREPYRVVFVDRASRDLVRVIRAADVVHSQNPSLDTAAIAAVLRKPHVMTLHGAREHAPRLRDRIANRLPDRRLYGSDFTWDTWEPRGRRDGSDKLPYISDLPTGVIEPDRRRGFVFVSRWVPNKGVDVLVEAYDRAEIDREQWPLVLVGDGMLRPSIEQEIDRRGLDTVEITGYLGGEARDAVVRNAKWIVIPPNWHEPFGLTAIEARHVGVPCIITRDGGLTEAAGPLSLSCEPGDAGQLARLLEFAAAMDESTYAWLSAATRADLLAKLRPNELYLDLYRELAGR